MRNLKLYILLLGLFFIPQLGLYSQNKPNYDSIYSKILTSDDLFIDDTSSTNPLYALMDELSAVPDSYQVIRIHTLIRQQEEYFMRKKDEVSYAKLAAKEMQLFMIFRGFYKSTEIEKYLSEVDELISVLKRNNLARELGQLFFELGSFYFGENENKSLTYHLLALAQKSNDKNINFYSARMIGVIYRRAGNYEKAIEYFKLAAKYDNNSVRLTYSYVSYYYSYLHQCDSAKRYLDLSADPNLENNPFYQRAKTYYRICIGDYEGAIPMLKEAIMFWDNEPKESSTFYYQISYLTDLYKAYRKINETENAKNVIEKVKILLQNYNKDLMGFQSAKLGYELLEEYSNDTHDYSNAYFYSQVIKSLNDSLMGLGELKVYEAIQAQNQYEKKLNDIEQEWTQKNLYAEQKLRNQRIIGVLIVIVLLGLVVFVVFQIRSKRKIRVEKQRSEDLLLNILPVEVAEELKQKGSAAPRQFDEVTVLFTDFVGFTRVSEKLSPTELVSEIHECFTAFDAIIQKYGLEKIKTIGDAYLAVSGLPKSNPEHAQNAVKAAKEIRDFIEERKSRKESFSIRIGLHSGSVVAGIVGVKKYAYDIWGDTVNTAARMEQNCEPGKVNISQTTFGLVKENFSCEHRGKIQAKNKGEIDMYYVN